MRFGLQTLINNPNPTLSRWEFIQIAKDVPMPFKTAQAAEDYAAAIMRGNKLLHFQIVPIPNDDIYDA